MPDDLKQKVKRFIRDHALLRGREHVLVAVSGGADSVALLNILRELSRPLRLRLTVAHLNHQLRGKDAEEDACFVKQLARRLRLDFALGRVNVPRLAGRLGISLEMAGRKARYDFFEKTALARRCDVVATAHTADDNVESILIMLLRGCGLQGLTGIPPLSRTLSQTDKITVVRPLLGTDRRAIEKYLRERNLIWREDISNADPAFLRNRVRHELLPLLEAKYNKGIKETLNRMSVVLREENDFIERFAEKAHSEAGADSLMNRKATHILDSCFHGNDRLDTCVCLPAVLCTALQAGHSRLDSPRRSLRRSLGRESRFRPGQPTLNARQLTKYHIAVRRRIVRRWLLANGVNSETINFQLINRIDSLIMNPAGGRSLELAGGIIIRRNYQRLTIGRARASLHRHYLFGGAGLPELGQGGSRPTFQKFLNIKINIPGITVLPGTGLRVKTEIAPGIDRERAVFGKFPVRASVSLKKLGQKQILVRPWRRGDRMNPYGLKGSKKVQDIFADAKAPVALRHRLPIFVCGREIIWIPGYRIAEGWQVPDAAANALHLTVERA